MVKVSIIVAIYNQEKFLSRCVVSLINQTLKDIEIILVNDGSTDSSLQIAQEYAKKDSRIIVLSQKNAKQGSARNRGLEIARGEFVTFVDSDDWIELNFCELLYNAATKYNVNIAASTTTRDYNNKFKYHLRLKEEKTYYDINSIVKALEYNFITHGKLYRFENIKNLRFEENVLYEDGLYTLKAFNIEHLLVTVPNARYHYYSNPISTMKQKLNPKLENDKISTSLQTYRYAKENNIDVGDFLLIKESHLLWAVKHYYERKDFYLFGIKLFSKQVQFDNVKNFVVFNTACFGDVLLCNSLCQNIKNIFPESRIIFVCDKNWVDVIKYQDKVDEVVVFDKNGKNKGILGLFKFIKDFPYKNIYASLITYKNERNFLLGKLLKSRFVISPDKKYKNNYVPERHNLLIESLTNKPLINYPIKFNLPNNIINPLQNIIPNRKYLTLCCISKNPVKDMPIDMAMELIKKINLETDCQVVFTGFGDKSFKYAETLIQNGASFINLVNKTSLLELGAVLKDSVGLISVDTGTMHFAYSMGVKTICLFFEKGTTHLWAPQEEIYKNTVVLDKDINVNKIINNFNELRNMNE